MNTLYIFIDESGNMDFSPKGTKNFVLAAIATTSPLQSSNYLQHLKYQLLTKSQENSNSLQFFHASEDRQWIRDKVFEQINNCKDFIQAYYLFATKNKTHPSLQNKISFYSLLGGALVKYLLKVWQDSQYEKIIIILDKVLKGKEQQAFLKAVKPKLKKVKKPYSIYFHNTSSDFNGQIADYLAWAKFVSLERNENRPLESIKNIPKNNFDIFGSGTTEYY
jgi:hypothetical protein